MGVSVVSLLSFFVVVVCVAVEADANLWQLDPKRNHVDKALDALRTGLAECGYQKA